MKLSLFFAPARRGFPWSRSRRGPVRSRRKGWRTATVTPPPAQGERLRGHPASAMPGSTSAAKAIAAARGGGARTGREA